MNECPFHIADDRGSIGVVVALMLVVLLGFGALSIDVGRALVVKRELQNVADAGALAGARQLGQALFYKDPALGVLQNVAPLQTPVRSTVQTIAPLNNAEGVSVGIPAGDVLIGIWNGGAVAPSLINPNAVQVVAGRDGSPNPPLLPFLAGIIGVNTMNVNAQAAARLSSTSRTNAGDLDAPFVINVAQSPAVCGQAVSYPGGSLGMTTFSNPAPLPSSPKAVRTAAVNALIPANPAIPVPSPATVANQNALNLVFAQDVILVPSNAITRYPVGSQMLVAVVGGNVNLGGAPVILGYATVRVNVINIITIQVTVLCNRTGGTRGENQNDFGTSGLIPALVL